MYFLSSGSHLALVQVINSRESSFLPSAVAMLFSEGKYVGEPHSPHSPMWMHLNFKYLFYIYYSFTIKNEMEASFQNILFLKSPASSQMREDWEGLLYLCKPFFFWGEKRDTERLKISTSHQYVCCFNLAFWISLKTYPSCTGLYQFTFPPRR